MIILHIYLKGNVTLRNKFRSAVGYRFDIPTDELGIPYLPLGQIIAGRLKEISAVRIGYARPVGYLGMLREAHAFVNAVPGGREWIRSCFTEDHYVPDKGYRMRSLKSGQVFEAPIEFEETADTNAAGNILAGITRIGEKRENVSGEVEFSLLDVSAQAGQKMPYKNGCEYHALKYSAMLLTPAIVQSPYEEEADFSYIPGGMIRRSLKERLSGISDNVICTNAYISEKGQRLLPVPLCISYVKLDKEQIRYRLSPGKDPDKVEQDVSFSDTYTGNFENHMMECYKPETERFTTGRGIACDAFARGQVFAGTIFGSDKEIRIITDRIHRNPCFHFGNRSEEGFGEAYVTVEQLCEEEAATENLAVAFDVVCLSDTLLLNDEGMPSVQERDFLRELERRMGVSDKLDVVGKYTDVCLDYGDYYGWNQAGPAVRCLKMGSVFRIAAKDGIPVDMAPVVHTFIGERTMNGYGEIMAYPSKNQYYRVACYEMPKKYDKQYPLSVWNAQIGARLINTVVMKVLESRVRGLARTDREEYLNGVDADALIPTDLLSVLKERFDPGVDQETMVRWYKDELEKTDL